MPTVPTGTLFALATTFAGAKTVSVLTNAAEAVVTSTAHGYSNGDIVEVTSGWGRANKRAFRIKSVTTDTFVLEGFNTTSTDLFPSGTGIGSVRKVTAWTQIPKILRPTSSGGDPKNVSVKFLEADVETSINDGFTAISETFDIDADEVGNAGYEALRTLTGVQTDTILRKTMKSGSLIFTPCRVALNENVKLSEGQINVCTVSINANNLITRYTS